MIAVDLLMLRDFGHYGIMFMNVCCYNPQILIFLSLHYVKSYSIL
jgi:hypothetical protein